MPIKEGTGSIIVLKEHKEELLNMRKELGIAGIANLIEAVMPEIRKYYEKRKRGEK